MENNLGMENKIVGEFLPDDIPQEEINLLPKNEQDFETAFQNMNSGVAQDLKNNDLVVKNVNPDHQAKIIQLANELKVNTNFVERNYDLLKDKIKKPDDYYDSLVEKNPGLSQWLSEHSNMGVAKDDIETLKKIEDKSKEQGYFSGLTDAVQSGIYKSLSNLAKIPALAATEPTGPAWLYEGASGNILREEYKTPIHESLYKNRVTKFLDKKAEENSPEAMSKSIITQGKNGDISGAAKSMSYQIAANAPNLLLLMVAGPSALPLMGAQSASGKFAENLEKGVPQDTALSNALVTGSIEAGVESIGGVGSVGFKESLKQVVSSLGKESAKEVFKTSLKTIAKQGGTEGAEEFITSISQDLVDYGSGVNEKALDGILLRASDAFIVGAGSGVAMTSTAMSIERTFQQFSQNNQTESNKNIYENLNEIAKESKLLKRSPEKFKEMVDKVTEASGVNNVYIQPEAIDEYFQSKNISPIEIANQLGILEQYNQSKESGTDLKIPVSDLIIKLGNTEHYAGLSNDIKFAPEQMTANEIKKERELINKEVKQVSEEALNKGYSFEKSAKELTSKVENTLKSAGQNPKLAKANAKLFETTIANMGARINVDPQELLGKYGFSIGNIPIVMKNGEVVVSTEGGPDVSDMQTPGWVTESSELNQNETIEMSKFDENGKLILDSNNLDILEKRINESDAGSRGAVDGVNFSTESTFPEFFKDKGYTKKETLNIISKFKSGKKLTEKQTDILKDLYDSMVDKINRREYFQSEIKFNKELIENKRKLEDEGFTFDVSENPYFDDSGNEISGPKQDEAGYSFSIYAKDDTGNEIAQANFIINEDGKLQANDYDGDQEAVNVDASFRKKGIATELYRMAVEHTGLPIEDVNSKTDFGKKFRDSIRKINPNIFKQENKGRIQFGKNTINIDIFKKGNESTFIHELGHFWTEVLKDLASDPNAASDIKNDYELIKKYAGIEGDTITTEQHEKMAESFEKYIMEGKAPSKELQSLFTKFRTWLLDIYRSIKGLDVELSDDIRGVFDRLLAAQESIDSAYNEMGYNKPLFADYKAIGMTDDQASAYIAATEDARIEAENLMNERVIEGFKKTKTQGYKDKYDLVKRGITNEVNKQSIYKAFNHLRYGKDQDGNDFPEAQKFKLNKSQLIEMFGKDVTEKLKGLYADDGFVSPDTMALMYGFKDGHELINLLKDLMHPQEYIQLKTKETMTDLYPELTNTLSGEWDIVNKAIEDAHNDKRSLKLRLELEHLLSNNLPVFKNAVKVVSRRAPNDKQVKAQATKEVSKILLKELNPNVYKNAERKHARLSGEYLAKGDIQAAFDSKLKEYYNYHLFKAATEVKNKIDKSKENFKLFFKSDETLAKTRDIDLINAGRAVLSMYGLGKPNGKPDDYLSKMKEYEPETYASVSALFEDVVNGATTYTEISVDKFYELSDTLESVWELSKTRMQSEIDGKKEIQRDIKIQLIAQINSIKNTADENKPKQTTSKWGAIGRKINSASADLKRVEHWADAMDVKYGGPFRKYIWNPVNSAVTKYKLQKIDVLKKYQDILESYRKNLTPQAIESKELNFIFKNKAELMMAILHTGNESNKQKLLVGRDFAEFNHAGILDTTRWDNFINRMHQEGVLTKADYDFAQQAWDLMDSLKPESQKAHKKMFGYFFNEITAQEIVTPFGTYKGGYIPAKTDMYEVEDAAIRAEQEAFEKNNNSFMFPTTGKGFTKSRIEQYMKPLSLDMNLLGSHIDSVLRFTYIEPTVKEVARIVSDKGFREVLSEIDPDIAKDALIPWLQRAAQQKTVIPNSTGLGKVTDAVASFLRKNVASQIMFGNVTNTLQQTTGLVVAMSIVKPKHIRNALADYVSNNKELTKFISENSDWMNATQNSNIFEVHSAINEIIVNPTAFENIQKFSQKHTYFLQSAAQNMVNTIVFKGAYDQAIESMDHKEAVRFAESTVRKTQGSMSPEDVSRFETGSATEMLFKQFVGYFNMLANLNAGEFKKIERSVGLKKGAGKAFYLYMTAFMLPAFLSEAIVIAMSGKGLDQDDDDSYLDDFLKAFFGSQLKTATATIPYGGQVVMAGVNRIMTDQQYDDRINISPVISLVEGSAGAAKTVYDAIMTDAGIQKKTVKDVLQFVSVFTGVPTGPVQKAVGYQMDVMNNKIVPTGPIDYTRGLLTGKGDK